MFTRRDKLKVYLLFNQSPLIAKLTVLLERAIMLNLTHPLFFQGRR